MTSLSYNKNEDRWISYSTKQHTVIKNNFCFKETENTSIDIVNYHLAITQSLQECIWYKCMILSNFKHAEYAWYCDRFTFFSCMLISLVILIWWCCLHSLAMFDTVPQREKFQEKSQTCCQYIDKCYCCRILLQILPLGMSPWHRAVKTEEFSFSCTLYLQIDWNMRTKWWH